MLLGIVFMALAQAESIAEEVVIYSDPLAPWEGTRWWVGAESISAVDRLQVQAKGGAFSAPAWQVETVIGCHVVQRKRRGGVVECVPEEVAVRVATQTSWQRAEDRRTVAGGVQDLRTELLASSLRLRVRGYGDVTVLKEQSGTGATVRVLGRAMDAFNLELPDTGWRHGDQWTSIREPLLDLNTGRGTFGLEVAVHMGSLYKGQRVIQTLASSQKETVVGTFRETDDTWERFQPCWTPDGGVPEERTVRSTLHLDAVGLLDADLGFVTERVWSVIGVGATPLMRSGRLRLLDEDEDVALGASGQVSAPKTKRPELPVWGPLDPAAR
jgi:hypothetical protein